ncbi:MAG: archaeal heat shock protein Hsp20 [Candidatus Bathyarchaeia archaeon]
MSWDEFFPSWFRRRVRGPFSRDWLWGDIDAFMRDMEDYVRREFEEFSRSVPRDLVRERRLPDGSTVKEWGPFVYGYSMTIGPDGKPVIREFGNVRPSLRATPRGYPRPSLDVKEEREPLVDVISTNNEVKVVAELPGVEKNEIQLHATESTLTINVDTPQRRYFKEVELPDQVDPKTAKSTYKNGVLEVTLAKVREKKPKGEPIKIE